MAGFIPAIHEFSCSGAKNMDARNKSGHDEGRAGMAARGTVRAVVTSYGRIVL